MIVYNRAIQNERVKSKRKQNYLKHQTHEVKSKMTTLRVEFTTVGKNIES